MVVVLHLEALLGLLLLTVPLGARPLKRADTLVAEACPLRYERHSIEDVASGAVAPYLYGGIYDRANCTNCKTEGLWANFCGRKPSGIKLYDLQLCDARAVKGLMTTLLQQEDAGALTLTPCDLWAFMRGRTSWIIG